MRYIITALITLSLSLITTETQAQPAEGENDFCERVKDCHPTPVVKKKKPKRRYKRKAKKPTPPVVITVVEQHVGEKGDKGDIGPRGPRGLQGRRGADGTARLRLGIHYMAAALDSIEPLNYTWAHGPALVIGADLRKNRSVELAVGYAPGRHGGVMFRAGVLQWNFRGKQWLGGGAALYGHASGVTNGPGGLAAGLNLTMAVRKRIDWLTLQVQAGPAVGVAHFPSRETSILVGVAGTAGASVSF